MRAIAAAIIALFLNGGAAFSQTPAAAEDSSLRARCEGLADEKARTMATHVLSVADGASFGMSVATVDALNKSQSEMLGSSHSSKYEAASDRCYVRLYEHKRNGQFETQHHGVYDARTGDLVAFARRVNGKETGYVFDAHKGPWVPPADCGNCTAGVGWNAAIGYMDERMADRRN
jgi:hypothetical protein